MKVEILEEHDKYDLEKSINDFIENKKIIDIKYSISHVLGVGYSNDSYSAMVIYEERKECCR